MMRHHRTSMRILWLLLLGCGFNLSAYAADKAPAQVPLPPPPQMVEPGLDETPVTITKDAEQTTVEEYRANGQLYMIKITPKHGKPYYLIDSLGDGKFARQESLDSGLRVPHWVIKKF